MKVFGVSVVTILIVLIAYVLGAKLGLPSAVSKLAGSM